MNKLLALLQDGRFHSGSELGAALGVSRSSVWKHIKRIEEEQGVCLFKVPGKGYRLTEPLSLLDPARCKASAARFGWALDLHQSLDSTNAQAFRLLQSQVEPPFVILAEAQTSGRGRRGRVWESPFGQNLYFTLMLKIAQGTTQLSGLSLVVGLAVAHALRDAGLSDVGVKWPNDIYAGGKKIAGILLELTGDPTDLCHVAIGIGINVNMLGAAAQIDQPWTSVRMQKGVLSDRSELVEILCASLHHTLQRHAEGGFESLRGEWEAQSLWKGQRCSLTSGTREIVGELLGVNEEGALRMRVDGVEHVFSGGELSLRLRHDS